MLKLLTEQLRAAESLTGEQIAAAVVLLIDAQISTEEKAAFLTALAQKGETTEEISAFARELRHRSVTPPLDAETRSREILDVCGTGGDRLNTFNISTTVALIAAAAGVTVAKHGNRAVTSQSGSADVLEALGIRIDLPPEQAAQSLHDHGFAFFFAPNYHPAFQHLAPARQLCAGRGQRTIFNFLGPLLNPARPSAQLVGVPRPALCEPMARVLQALGVRRAMVVSGEIENSRGPVENVSGTKEPESPRHLDELSTLGDNTIAEFYQDSAFSVSVMSSENYPLQPATVVDLAGGDRAANAEIIRLLLRGEERGPKRDAVLLNASAALFVAGRVRSMLEGWDLAGELIDNGAARAKLAELVAASKKI